MKKCTVVKVSYPYLTRFLSFGAGDELFFGTYRNVYKEVNGTNTALITEIPAGTNGTLTLSGGVDDQVTFYGSGFVRDKIGRIIEKSETVGGVSSGYVYSYDAAGRLETVTKDGVNIGNYGYDANGNRSGGTYDEQDRLLTWGDNSYTYTANGELAAKTNNGMTTRYDYDELGNLLQVVLPGDVTLDYLIDGQNRRIGKKVNGSLVQGFLYQDQLNPVAELDASGNLLGDRPI